MEFNYSDVRQVLEEYSHKEIKEIAKRHNKVARIKLNQKKDALIADIAKQYKEVQGNYLIPNNHPLVLMTGYHSYLQSQSPSKPEKKTRKPRKKKETKTE
jgi:hypothetical protein